MIVVEVVVVVKWTGMKDYEDMMGAYNERWV